MCRRGWRGGEIAATVPGCVHTDLLAAGVIPDPYLDDHELDTIWIGRCDWTYRRAFDVAAEALERGHVELCFDGLDTVATVEVNGVEVLTCRDMHVRQRVSVKGYLKSGENEVAVHFAAPLVEAAARRDALGDLPRAGGGSNPSLPHNFLRKMACNMGWDWGPVVPTCGIWRGVRLEAWGAAGSGGAGGGGGGRIGDVRPSVLEATAERAVVKVDVDVEGAGEVRLTLTSPGEPGGDAVGEVDGDTITVMDPQRWWPRGHDPSAHGGVDDGVRPLYTLRVELVGNDGAVLDVKQCRVGLRTVALVTEADPSDASWPVEELGRGESMALHVNGKAVYCKGANWIPDDCFPHRVDAARYRRRLEQAAGANMNMIRVWGGGLYESADFYDACDELGLMVWQDFLCACAAYPEEAEFPGLIEAEARDNVSRLAHHASLVLWNGCNENLWGYHAWNYEGQDWPDFIGERGWGLRYYYETFPDAVAELGAGVPYWPGSPSNGVSRETFESGQFPNDNTHGNRHVWDVWHGPGHYLRYLGHHPRFCSEFGFHGPPTWPTLERSVPEDQRHWDSRVMRLHNKNGIDKVVGDGQDKATARMADDFPVPDGPEGFEDWLYLATVMQARALTVGVGWFRSMFPWNQGALFWQLNDCWPCPSWSAIDGDGRAKPLLHLARRFFAPRVVNIGPTRPSTVPGWGEYDGPLRAYVHNDHDWGWQATLRVRHMHVDGRVLDEQVLPLEVAPRGAAHVDVNVGGERDGDTFLVAEMVDSKDAKDSAGGVRAFWWFAPDKEIAYPEPRFEATVSGDGSTLTVEAHTLLRDLCVFPERLHPEASTNDACVTLLPGESHTFHLDSPVPLDANRLVAPPVLRCVNDLARAGAAGPRAATA